MLCKGGGNRCRGPEQAVIPKNVSSDPLLRTALCVSLDVTECKLIAKRMTVAELTIALAAQRYCMKHYEAYGRNWQKAS